MRASAHPHPESTTMLTLSRISLVAVMALAINALADEPKPQPQRTILERHDQAGVPNKEIVIGTAALPPGAVIGFHEHPGDEAGYVLKGSLIWKTRGQPDKTLKAGDSFFNPRGAVHSVATVAGGEGALVVSTWIVDKGKPLATPVP
jgi:quercetin dioxygenase-like cupin family protein